MEVNKIVPIAVGFLGFGILIFAISQAKKQKNSVIYLDDNSTQTNASFDAKNIVDTLHLAMKDMGTDEDAIFEVLTGLTQNQFALVNKIFGFRAYNTFSGTSYGATNNYPLKVWLKEELSDAEYKTLKNNFPKYL